MLEYFVVTIYKVSDKLVVKVTKVYCLSLKFVITIVIDLMLLSTI